jgi:hypothetical protein
MACFDVHAWQKSRLWAAVCSGAGLALLIGTWVTEASAQGRRPSKSDEATYIRPDGTPIMAIVSIDRQRITVYDAQGPMLQSPVSTGKPRYETPPGIYTVLQKKVHHYSNVYLDAAMPYMQRITWSGIALHAGILPGYPASGGCIRMPMDFARQLYGRTTLGMRVVVVRDNIGPAGIVHPALFQPLAGEIGPVTAMLTPGKGGDSVDKTPAGIVDAAVATDAAPVRRRSLRSIAAAKADEAKAAAEKAIDAKEAVGRARVDAKKLAMEKRRAGIAVARAEARVRQAEWRVKAAGADSPKMQRAREDETAARTTLAEARAQLEAVEARAQVARELVAQRVEDAKAALAARTAAREDAKEAQDKLAPISVLVSRKTQRLYAKQARETLFETPVAIAEPDRPLGTYLFTAVEYANADTELRWSVVSMYRTASEAADGKRQRTETQARAAAADVAGARLALDRIVIPREAVERISEVVTPGSSLIVTDEPISRETSKHTDFIVVMSNEPQGGLKIRRPRRLYSGRSWQPYDRSPNSWRGPSFWWW